MQSQSDFEDNYEADCNFKIGQRHYPFTTSDFDACFNAVNATCTKDTTTNIDFKITTADTYLNGCRAFNEDAVKGDWVEMQVIDIDNVLGYGPNTVLKQWVYKWFMCPGDVCNLTTNYAGAIPQNCYIRVIYHSTGTVNDVKVWINWYLHKAI